MRARKKLAGWLLMLIVIVPLWTSAYGEDRFTVSGILTFSEGEVVFVSLYTQDRFNDFKNKPLPRSTTPRSSNSHRSRERQEKRNSGSRASLEGLMAWSRSERSRKT